MVVITKHPKRKIVNTLGRIEAYDASTKKYTVMQRLSTRSSKKPWKKKFTLSQLRTDKTATAKFQLLHPSELYKTFVQAVKTNPLLRTILTDRAVLGHEEKGPGSLVLNIYDATTNVLLTTVDELMHPLQCYWMSMDELRTKYKSGFVHSRSTTSDLLSEQLSQSFLNASLLSNQNMEEKGRISRELVTEYDENQAKQRGEQGLGYNPLMPIYDTLVWWLNACRTAMISNSQRGGANTNVSFDEEWDGQAQAMIDNVATMTPEIGDLLDTRLTDGFKYEDGTYTLTRIYQFLSIRHTLLGLMPWEMEKQLSIHYALVNQHGCGAFPYPWKPTLLERVAVYFARTKEYYSSAEPGYGQPMWSTLPDQFTKSMRVIDSFFVISFSEKERLDRVSPGLWPIDRYGPESNLEGAAPVKSSGVSWARKTSSYKDEIKNGGLSAFDKKNLGKDQEYEAAFTYSETMHQKTNSMTNAIADHARKNHAAERDGGSGSGGDLSSKLKKKMLLRNEEVCQCASCPGGVQTKKLLSCSRCNSVKYCSGACQKADWKSHKKVCKMLAKERSEKQQGVAKKQ